MICDQKLQFSAQFHKNFVKSSKCPVTSYLVMRHVVKITKVKGNPRLILSNSHIFVSYFGRIKGVSQ